MATPSEFGRRLLTLTDQKSLERISHAMGQAGKKAAADAVTADLGADLRMSNMRSKAKLTSGYDIEADGALLHLRPKGLWNLADKGRRRSGTIRPRKRKRALRTPQGPRASAHFGPSRGLGTVDAAVRIMGIEVPKAAAKALSENIGAL